MTPRARFILPTLAFAAITGCTDPDPPFPTDETLTPMLEYLVEDGESPALVLGLLEPDGTTRILTYGNTGTEAPLTPSSVFEIGSITKTFTGTLLADMVAKGEVALEDPLAQYLPDDVTVPTYNGGEITLVDLATHTSGLPGAPGHTPADPLNPWADWTPEKLYAWLSEYELPRAPGSAYEYSNVGMDLLGHALARTAGAPLDEVIRERILEPLGMTSTGYELEGDLRARAVQGHQLSDPVPYWTRTDAAAGAGGLNSNAEDLLTYLAANIGQPQTDLERAMRVAHEPLRPTDSEGEGIGLAWNTVVVNGHRIVSHSGGTGGFRTQIAFDPEREIGIVVLANTSTYTRSLTMEILSDRLPETYPEVAVEPETLAPYVGTYESQSGLPLYIRQEAGGFLTGQARDQVRFRMYPTSDSTFFSKRVPFVLVFRWDESRAVDDILLGVLGNTNVFTRTSDDTPSSIAVAGNVIPSLSAETIAIYAGSYTVESPIGVVEVTIYGEGDRLIGNVANQSIERLIPTDEAHTFVPATDPAARVVFTLENGRATGVTVRQGGLVLTGERR